MFIDIKTVPELLTITANESTLTFGGNVSLTDFMNTLQSMSAKYSHFSYGEQMAKHIDVVANVPVRSVSSPFPKHVYNFPQENVIIS